MKLQISERVALGGAATERYVIPNVRPADALRRSCRLAFALASVKMKFTKNDVDRMNPELLRILEGKKRELDRPRPFPPSIVGKLEEQFRLEWTYNSNAIEWNTLNLRETELVLNRGLTIGKKTLREHFEVLNHAEAIALLEDVVRKK